MNTLLQMLSDGAPASASCALDRGLQFGDGLFETVACVQGRARFLERHLERLAAGLARLRIRFDAWPELRSELVALAAREDRGLLKVIVTRGDALARGYAPHGGERARRYVLQYAWPEEHGLEAQTGVPVVVSRIRLGENPALAGLKHLNRLEQVLACAELDGRDAREALQFTSSDRLVSGTMSNVFLVREGRVLTPLLEVCGVAGVMRAVVLEMARQARIECAEVPLREADLATSKEMFLTNVRIGIWPVRSLEGRALEIGAVTRRLQSLLEPRLHHASER